jgi:transcriptional regulator with GAF, ATPase, and Fis domain
MANSSLHLNKVLNDILTGTLEITNASVGMIFLKDPNTNYLYLGASIGLSNAFADDFKNSYLEVGEGLSGRIAQSGEAIYIAENASHDLRIARAVLTTEDLNSFIGVPIYAKDEIVGVMNISTRPPQTLNKDEIHIISAIGTHIGSAIQNAKLYEERETLISNISKGKKEWETTFDSAFEYIILVDKEFNILRCNKTFVKHINQPVDKIIGNKFYNIFSYDSNNIDLQDYLNKNNIIEEVEVKTISEGWFYLSKKPIFDNNGILFLHSILAIGKNEEQDDFCSNFGNINSIE